MHSVNLNEEFGADADMLTSVLSDKGISFKNRTDYYKLNPLLKKCLDGYVPDLIQACVNIGLYFDNFKDKEFLHSVVDSCSPLLLDELYEVMEAGGLSQEAIKSLRPGLDLGVLFVVKRPEISYLGKESL